MTLSEIKQAVDSGKRVTDGAYEVIKDSNDKYLIKCHINGHIVGLTGLKGTKYENRPNHNLDNFKIID